MKIKTHIFENFNILPKSGDIITLSETNIHHLKNVLRIRNGDCIKVIINEELEAICEICDITNCISCKIIEQNFIKQEEEFSITVCFALCKQPQNELVAQKLTELGVKKIVYWESDFEAFKLKEKEAKLERLQKIIEMAARQSKQNFIPKCLIKNNLEDTLNFIKSILQKPTILFGATSGNTKKVRDIAPFKENKNIVIFIGPEGGFSPRETNILLENATPISFCNSILKAETASIVSVSQIMTFLI